MNRHPHPDFVWQSLHRNMLAILTTPLAARHRHRAAILRHRFDLAADALFAFVAREPGAFVHHVRDRRVDRAVCAAMVAVRIITGVVVVRAEQAEPPA